MSDKTITKLISLPRLLDGFLTNADITMTEHSVINKVLSKAARQHGVQANDIHVVEVTREVAGKKLRSFDLGFTNTDPQHAGDLITVTESNQRVWEPVNKVMTAEELFKDNEDALTDS